MDRELVSWRREFVRNEASGGNRDLLDAMPHLVGNLLSVSRAKRRAGVRGARARGERGTGTVVRTHPPSERPIVPRNLPGSYLRLVRVKAFFRAGRNKDRWGSPVASSPRAKGQPRKWLRRMAPSASPLLDDVQEMIRCVTLAVRTAGGKRKVQFSGPPKRGEFP
jgi:hypothetical protein